MSYLYFLIPLLLAAAFTYYASNKVNKTFNEFNSVRTQSGHTGYSCAQTLLSRNGVNDIALGQVKGKLTDHYNPTKKIVNLSESTYASNSLAAVAVAAHEIGHVMQKKDGYIFYKIRTAIVPIVNIGSFLAIPLVILGIILDAVVTFTDIEIGFYVALAGVFLYGGSLVFALVTLPVELNASRRAQDMLQRCGILTATEVEDGKQVLKAAALTYVASLFTSLIYFLSFLLRILMIFGKTNNRRK